MAFFRRWFRLLLRRRLDRDLAAELETHVALRAAAHQAAGMDAPAARRAAERQLGNHLALRERMREADLPLWFEQILRDFAHAARALRRSPAFSTAAVLTLALGIGAAVAMFSVVRAVLWDTLPFPDPARLVAVEESVARGGSFVNVDAAFLDSLRSANLSARFELLGWARDPAVYVHGFVADASLQVASPGFFPMLGARTELGRLSRAAGEVLVSDRFWRSRMGGDRGVLGTSLRVGGGVGTIVGVLDPGQGYPEGADVWLAGSPDMADGARLIGRLSSGERPAAAFARLSAAVQVVGRRVLQQHPYPDVSGLHLRRLRPRLAQPADQTALWILWAAVGCLLLIACANTANLLLARGLDRRRELELRRALGAGRVRLLRLLLAEGVWLALLGAGAGCGLAWLLLKLARLGPADVPRLHAVQLSPAALAFAALVAACAGLACASAPAWRLSRATQPTGETFTRPQKLRGALLTIEAALALTLLIGGLLLLRTFNRLWSAPLGYDPTPVTAVFVATPAGQALPAAALLARVRALPGVAAASYVDNLSLSGTNALYLHPAGVAPDSAPAVPYVQIGPGYATTLAIPLLAGRALTESDMQSARQDVQPVLINAALVQRFWPGSSNAAAVGKRLQIPMGARGYEAEVAGVLHNTRDSPSLNDPALPRIYLPLARAHRRLILLLRSPLPQPALLAEVRSAVAATSPRLTLGEPTPLAAVMADDMAQPRFRALLLDGFAALALLLAVVGVYGALAYHVRQRRREIGVRMALGAGRRAVLTMIFRQSAAWLAGGLFGGSLLAWIATRWLASLLFGVSPLDPLSWLAAAALLTLAVVLATCLPARRATQVDPSQTLRLD
jgi:predicted permease